MSPVVTPPRRLLLLTLLAGVLGLLGGIAAWVLLHLIGLITNLALFQQWGWKVPSFTELHPGPQILIAAVGGAVLISLLAKWSMGREGLDPRQPPAHRQAAREAACR